MEIKFENLALLEQISNDLSLVKKLLSSTQSSKRWYSAKEIAKYLSYSQDTIYRLKGSTFIEGKHFFNKNGKILFDRVAIDDWVITKESYDTDKSKQHIVDNILSSIKKG